MPSLPLFVSPCGSQRLAVRIGAVVECRRAGLFLFARRRVGAGPVAGQCDLDADDHSGNWAAKGKSRPRAANTKRMEVVLARVLDGEAALEKWVAAFKRNFESADLWTTEFLPRRCPGPSALRLIGAMLPRCHLVARATRWLPTPGFLRFVALCGLCYT